MNSISGICMVQYIGESMQDIFSYRNEFVEGKKVKKEEAPTQKKEAQKTRRPRRWLLVKEIRRHVSSLPRASTAEKKNMHHRVVVLIIGWASAVK